jgi:hypothetical protein
MSDRSFDKELGKLICAAWNGSRSPEFKKFRRDLLSGAYSIFLQDDDESVGLAMENLDSGSPTNALPGQAQAGYLNAVRRETRRQAKAFYIIYLHIDNERLREMLDALPRNNRRGSAAWALIVAQCDQGASDLYVLDHKKDFTAATIEGEIGLKQDSIIEFSRLIISINARLPHASIGGGRARMLSSAPCTSMTC